MIAGGLFGFGARGIALALGRSSSRAVVSPVTCTTEARLVDVRYRPSVATSATYAVRDIHGVEHFVTYKVHLGGRAENRVVGGRYADRVRKVCDPLLPYELLPERMASLWVFPADPELRGAVRALNSARTASWIGSLGLIGDRASSPALHRARRCEWVASRGVDGGGARGGWGCLGRGTRPGVCGPDSRGAVGSRRAVGAAGAAASPGANGSLERHPWNSPGA
ncbi:MAG: hypothetical protein ACJAQ3_000679 [Planctomycetota bacterium]